MSEKADREIPKPKPAVRAGVRYEVVRNARFRGLPQAGGVIVAIDTASGRELWVTTVYRVTFDDAEEKDTQEVFVTRLRLADDSRLEVTNERGEVFLVDVATGSVLGGP